LAGCGKHLIVDSILEVRKTGQGSRDGIGEGSAAQDGSAHRICFLACVIGTIQRMGVGTTLGLGLGSEPNKNRYG
jgi:hypothetical protein